MNSTAKVCASISHFLRPILVKKTISEGLKCTKPAGATCLCGDFWDHFDYKVDFKKEHKKGIKIVTECISGSLIHDTWRISAVKDGRDCGISIEKKFKHDNEKVSRCRFLSPHSVFSNDV